MSASAEAKVASLRRRTKTQLLEQLRENKRELAALRVAQVTGGAPNKLAKMCATFLSLHQSARSASLAAKSVSPPLSDAMNACTQ